MTLNVLILQIIMKQDIYKSNLLWRNIDMLSLKIKTKIYFDDSIIETFWGTLLCPNQGRIKGKAKGSQSGGKSTIK